MENTQHSTKQVFEPKSLKLTKKLHNRAIKKNPQMAETIRKQTIGHIEMYSKPNFGSFVLNHRKFK